MDWSSGRLGGAARARVILLLAAALGLSGADLGAVGSMATILQERFSIDETRVGMLITASQGAAAISTLFFGWLVDRTRRTRTLAVAVLLWGLAMLACGGATSYLQLLIARIGLGVVAAATLPCTASLVGDYFPGRERGKIYGYILTGEMVGTGLGFLLSGETAMWWWRMGFWMLFIPVLPLAWWLYRLPEPQRGGQSRLEEGQREIRPHEKGAGDQAGARERLMARQARQAGVSPRAWLVRDEDPGKQSLRWAVRYVLSIPTNMLLIICSALGYTFFADARTFGVEYMQSWYDLSHSLAVVLLVFLGGSMLGGIWIGGYLGDRLLAKGYLPARAWVATGAFWACAVLLLGSLLFHTLWLAAVFFVLSAFPLGAVNPPLDSARLDIMHPNLWGRAESIRVALRNASEAIAPVTFGWLVAALGGGAEALHQGFLLMLIPLALAGALGFITFRTYPPDAAAAAAYTRRTFGSAGPQR